jgi:hypothetical protein
MIVTRRKMLAAIAAAVFCPAVLVGSEIQPTVAPRNTWTREQLAGRTEIERHFRRRRIPRAYREQCFVGLVAAAREGRKGRELIAGAAAHCRKTYGGQVDWLTVLTRLLQIAAALLTILFLFI